LRQGLTARTAVLPLGLHGEPSATPALHRRCGLTIGCILITIWRRQREDFHP
jgi:hypothetical protein